MIILFFYDSVCFTFFFSLQLHFSDAIQSEQGGKIFFFFCFHVIFQAFFCWFEHDNSKNFHEIPCISIYSFAPTLFTAAVLLLFRKFHLLYYVSFFQSTECFEYAERKRKKKSSRTKNDCRFVILNAARFFSFLPTPVIDVYDFSFTSFYLELQIIPSFTSGKFFLLFSD